MDPRILHSESPPASRAEAEADQPLLRRSVGLEGDA